MARRDIFGSVIRPGDVSAPTLSDVSGYARSRRVAVDHAVVRGAVQEFGRRSRSGFGRHLVRLRPHGRRRRGISGIAGGDSGAGAGLSDSGQASPGDCRPLSDRLWSRRVKVARQLGRPVRAVVKKMDDEDHVIAQGQENAARANLSFIERTLFADRILKRGHSPETVKSALAARRYDLFEDARASPATFPNR